MSYVITILQIQSVCTSLFILVQRIEIAGRLHKFLKHSWTLSENSCLVVKFILGLFINSCLGGQVYFSLNIFVPLFLTFGVPSKYHMFTADFIKDSKMIFSSACSVTSCV